MNFCHFNSFLTLCKWNEYLNDNRLKLCLHMLMPKNHSTITCKKGAKILPTFSCIVNRITVRYELPYTTGHLHFVYWQLPVNLFSCLINSGGVFSGDLGCVYDRRSQWSSVNITGWRFVLIDKRSDKMNRRSLISGDS